MPKRMLIDSSHPEETRVVVIDGQRVDEFDFEAASKRPLKGNIYLAKVTRVEPSLQAAFVEYGGNRQGFLAFSEIHPDYYQIPVADRQALIAEQQEEARRRADDEFEAVATGTALTSDEELEAEDETSSETDQSEAFDAEAGDSVPGDHAEEGEGDDSGPVFEAEAGEHADNLIPQARTNEPSIEVLAEEEAEDGVVDQQAVADAAIEEAEHGQYEIDDVGLNAEGQVAEDQSVDEHGESRAPQPLHSQRPSQRWVRRRHYKIQEVIKRKQIMLVQVVKEERGTKGAALTTFLSLAGRYCVLMPNTPRGGGISRKITNAADRSRLKAAAATLELPEGMGLIIRTAGANRTKLEIKRDYEYLLRLWDQIRELTLQSNAPACVYEEGDIIKRAIRDLYNKDVSEIVVEGEEGYKNAKEFMRMLMPSHAKNVKQYRDPVPVFQKHHIEAQLDAMFQPTVTLKSGGYIVINQTEALVSIDVNSGRATREHSIEETAHKTNLEAADEVGRQLRLRDLAGLIVIDFIDMEDSRNDRDVEKRLRDAVKHDRARVQIGKISQFGLLEMSRQRLRAGVVASSTVPCPHCGGQGIVRSVESTALRVLRALDEEGQRARAAAVNVHVAHDVALYTLNQKRHELARIETDYAMAITFDPKDNLMAGSFELERVAARVQHLSQLSKPAVSVDALLAVPTDMSEQIEEPEEIPVSGEQPDTHTSANGTQPAGGKKRRRRRRTRGGRAHPVQEDAPSATSATEPAEFGGEQAAESGELAQPADPTHIAEEHGANGQQPGTSRRRRRRRRKPHGASSSDAQGNAQSSSETAEGTTSEYHNAEPPLGHAVVPNAPSEPVWSLGSDRAEAAATVAHEPVGQMYYRREDELQTDAVLADRSPERAAANFPEETASVASSGVNPEKAEEPKQPARRGWWQRTFKNND
jgi:ribonuclease E